MTQSEKKISTLRNIGEALAVGVFFIIALLPIRLFFVEYVTDHWLGSLGMITVITVSLIILSKKGYLGWFGTAFIRQMNRIHKGKRKYIAIPMMALYLSFFISTLVGIEMGNTIYQYPKEEFVALLPNEIDPTLHSSFNAIKDAEPEDMIKGFMTIGYLIVFRFDVWAIFVAILDDLADGYVRHFAMVFLVEQIEVIGVIIYFKLKKVSF